MDLNAHGARGVLGGANFVQAQHFARRVVELVMVYFDMSEGGVKLDIDVAHPRRELEGRHGGWWRGWRGVGGVGRGRWVASREYSVYGVQVIWTYVCRYACT